MLTEVYSRTWAVKNQTSVIRDVKWESLKRLSMYIVLVPEMEVYLL